MKVAKGKAKGHHLKTPIVPDINPVISYQRQFIFDLIEKEANFIFKNKIGLDLFAGSGSLGIEALSNGAQRVNFVDRHPEACKTMTENLDHSYFLGKYQVHQKDVRDYLMECYQEYDFIFIDPDPRYSYSLLPQIIRLAATKLEKNGIIVLKLFKPLTTSFYPLEVLIQQKLTEGFLQVLTFPGKG